MVLLNNTKEENGIEVMTVSGIDSNCGVKGVKNGTNIIFVFKFLFINLISC